MASRLARQFAQEVGLEFTPELATFAQLLHVEALTMVNTLLQKSLDEAPAAGIPEAGIASIRGVVKGLENVINKEIAQV
jgi:hypothetical protein